MPEAPEAGVDLLLSGLLGFFLLRLLVIAGFLLHGPEPVGARVLAWLLLKPFALAVVTAALAAALRLLRGVLRPRTLRLGALLACAALLGAQLAGPSAGTPRLAEDLLALLPALGLPPALALLLRGRPRPGLPLSALGAAACAACVLALRPGRAPTAANAFGLASAAPNTVQVAEYPSGGSKDGYPACRFEYNSLGWRDEEPPSGTKGRRRRLLLVGDSFVWGDGIPSNEETLAARLRAALDRRAPGRWQVMSAAYPGLGLYGYGRFIDAIAPGFLPDVVLVGYLGGNDHDLFDAQRVLDSLPSGRLLRNLVLNSGAAQHVCEASAVHGGGAGSARFARLREQNARKASERGYRLVFLCYLGCPDLPASAEAIELSPSLRYTGRGSPLWYAKDFHPKPELNGILAARLAQMLVSGRRSPRLVLD